MMTVVLKTCTHVYLYMYIYTHTKVYTYMCRGSLFGFAGAALPHRGSSRVRLQAMACRQALPERYVEIER